MNLRLALATGALPLFAACSTLVTREAIESCGAPIEDREHALELFAEAIDQANGYLASEQRISLPAAHYEEAEDGTLVFVTETKRWPIRIRHSASGNLVVWFGFRAQERDDGFVVGSSEPDEHPEIDNSMFRSQDGEWHEADSIARLILHETAHTVHDEGTVGYWNTIAYYAEAIFLFRSVNHSAENRPRAVSSEFLYYRWIRNAEESGNEEEVESWKRAFAEHLALEKDNCVHGLPEE